MDRHDSPAVSLLRGLSGLSRRRFRLPGALRQYCPSRTAPGTIGVISQNSGGGSQDGVAWWLLGVLLKKSRQTGSQPGRPMTREDLLFVISVVWFVTLCGAAGWMLFTG